MTGNSLQLPIPQKLLPPDGTEPTGEERLRLTAILISYVAWPLDDGARNEFLLEPLVPDGRGLDKAPATGNADIVTATLDRVLWLIEQIATTSANLHSQHERLLLDLQPELEIAKGLLTPRQPEHPARMLADRLNDIHKIAPDGRPHSLQRTAGRKAMQTKIIEATEQFWIAGTCFLVATQLALHHCDAESGTTASLAQAQHITAKYFGLGPAVVRNCWRSHKSVAHISAAAALILAKRPNQSLAERPQHATFLAMLKFYPHACLSLAEALAGFGSSYKSPHSKSIALLPAPIWRAPGAARLQGPVDSLVPQLTAEQLSHRN
jgi:hypothetical protein